MNVGLFLVFMQDDMPVVVANDAGDRVTPCATTLSGKENVSSVSTLLSFSHAAL